MDIDFRTPYEPKEFVKFLSNFLPDDFQQTTEPININDLSFKPDRIKKVKLIGNVPSLENLHIYEIEHESESDPRVTLSRETFRLMSNYGVRKALAIFISQNSHNYRFSLATIDLKLEGSRVTKDYSNPHRYSFFLGPDSKTHTPYEYLVNKDGVRDFEDLKSRFSIEVVNKDFYSRIAELFTNLAGGKRFIGRKEIDEKGHLQLPGNPGEEIKKEFTVRLIGRLLFSWFLKKKCSDKGLPLLSEEILSSKSVEKNKGYYHTILEPLFFQVLNTPSDERIPEFKKSLWNTVPFLNGGLFAPHEGPRGDYYELGVLKISKHINTLKVPDDWMFNLFQVFETYNFTVDENTTIDVELSIDPEMLGRIFENLLAEINPETSETVRKSTGSYYTPRPIVEYMVDESIKQYLLTKTKLPEEKIVSLLSYEINEINLTNLEKESTIEALDTIKIIDPACGSGAFPMGTLQKILLILQKVDSDSKKWMEKKLAKIGDSIIKKTLMEKLESDNFNYIHKLGIVRDAIYGVDIQPIAVEISKLRFFLSLIVDEKVNDSKENRGIESLPNLEFKFVCANSLIGLPKLQPHQSTFDDVGTFNTEQGIGKLKELRDNYLRSYGDEKQRIEKEFEKIQSELFRSAIKSSHNTQTLSLATWKPFCNEPSSWFDPEWMFGIKDGFDIVIANPPYVDSKRLKHVSNILKKFKTYKGTADLYVYFYETGVNLLKLNGTLSFITSNKWIRSEYGRNLRRLLLQKTNPLFLIDFGTNRVFDATVDSNILLIQNSVNKDNFKICPISEKFIENNLIEYFSKYFISAPKFTEEAWLLNTNEKNSLKEKIEKNGTPLKDFGVSIFRGIVTGLNDAFVIDNDTKDKLIKQDKKNSEIIKPMIKGKEIRKYKYDYANLWLINAHNGIKEKNIPPINVKKDYPTIYKFLEKFLPEIEKRQDQGEHWSNLRNCTYLEEFEKEKIIWQGVAKRIEFSYDIDKIFSDVTTFFMTGKNLKYLLSIFNSKFFEYALLNIYLEGDTFKSKNQILQNFPVPDILEPQQKPFIEIVDKILAITQSSDYLENPAKKEEVKEYEHQIDQLVYKLYTLTPDEIAIIESGKK